MATLPAEVEVVDSAAEPVHSTVEAIHSTVEPVHSTVEGVHSTVEAVDSALERIRSGAVKLDCRMGHSGYKLGTRLKCSDAHSDCSGGNMLIFKELGIACLAIPRPPRPSQSLACPRAFARENGLEESFAAYNYDTLTVSEGTSGRHRLGGPAKGS